MKLRYLILIFTFICAFINVNAQTEAIDTTDQEVYVFVEVQPQFIGGDSARLAYLANTIKYPRNAMVSRVEGTVYVQFIVEKDGSITNVKKLRGVSRSIDKESLRAVRGMPKWKPAFNNGKVVRCQFKMPIKFELTSDPYYNMPKEFEPPSDPYYNIIDTDTSLIAETPPEFIGGDAARLQFLSEVIVYPDYAIYKGIQGTVYTYFVVEKDGSISNVNVVSGIGGGCDEVAINAIKKMPKWKPGVQRGKVVRALFKMPVEFKLAPDLDK